MSRRELADAMRAGAAIDPEALVGWAYRGVSLGLPAFVERLSWKTFVKTFVRDEGGGVAGYNVRVVQEPYEEELSAPTPLRDKGGAPVTFGPYVVTPLDPARHRAPCAEGLVLDYGAPKGARGTMVRLRDPITAINEGDATLLLGCMYMDLGVKIPTPSFFTLQRVARVDDLLGTPS